MDLDEDVAKIVQDVSLCYPVRNRDDLVASLQKIGMVTFLGNEYVAAQGGELLPPFLFPMKDQNDFTDKVGELLVSRGLVPFPPSAPLGRPFIVQVPSDRPTTHIGEVIARLELALCSPVHDGLLPQDRVDAIDIITHALEFTRHPDGLRLWREALWGHRLHPDAKGAIEAMGEYVTAAAQRGEWESLTAICDCVEVLLEEDMLEKRSPVQEGFAQLVPRRTQENQHIGGTR